MPDEIKQFRTAAKSSGTRAFKIDDELFHLAPVGLNVSDVVAELQGQLPTDQTPTADDLLAKLKPLIDPADFERFADYCKHYVMPSEFIDIMRHVVGVITGRDPTLPASSPAGSVETGAPSPVGASRAASAGRSSSLSQKASTPTSSRSASGPTKKQANGSTRRSSRRTS
jgi:hypothetical protein